MAFPDYNFLYDHACERKEAKKPQSATAQSPK